RLARLQLLGLFECDARTLRVTAAKETLSLLKEVIRLAHRPSDSSAPVRGAGASAARGSRGRGAEAAATYGTPVRATAAPGVCRRLPGRPPAGGRRGGAPARL